MKPTKRVRVSSPALSSPVTPLTDSVNNQVIPWAESHGDEWFTLCDPANNHWPPLASPTARIVATKKSLRGRRVAVKAPSGRRNVPVSSQLTASWPADGAQSSRTAMFLCILKGTADMRVGDYILSCGAGTFLFVPSEVPLDDGSRPHLVGENLAARGCSVLWIAPSGAGIACWRCSSQGKEHTTGPLESCYILYPTANQLFETFVQELARPKSSPKQRALTCRPLLLALLAIIAREMRAGNLLQFAHQRVDQNHLEDRADPIGRAQEYIRSHLNQPLTIDLVARLCYLSRSQFTRRFREETGTSFNTFVTQCRLEEARYLLRTTNWNIEMVCKSHRHEIFASARAVSRE